MALTGLPTMLRGVCCIQMFVACQRGAPQGAPNLLRFRPAGAMRVEIAKLQRDDGQSHRRVQDP